MMNKDEIKERLDELKIKYSDEASKKELEDLLPKEPLKEAVQETATPSSDSSRKKKWKEFLEAYKIQNPTKHEIKMEKGEFNSIPDSFK